MANIAQRPVLIGLIGVCLVVIGTVAGWLALQHEERVDTAAVTPPAVVAPPSQTATAPAAPTAPAPVPPSFDVVRINPNGDAVMAGRAAPNATVHIFDGDREIGKVTADARGEWVFVPTDPLPPGSRELSLTAHVGDEDIKSDQVVVLAVPEHGKDLAGKPAAGGGQPLVVATSRSGLGGSRVLQGPGLSSDPSRLSLDLVGVNDEGALTLSGHAPANATVQVYVDNRLLGRVVAGADGRWQLAPEEKIAVGKYTLRLDEVASDGKVVMRVELPFARSSAEEMAAADSDPAHPSRVTVKPGDSLWRIARRMTGRGMAYLVIYEANKDQIRDPDLIYPGQVFHVTRTN